MADEILHTYQVGWRLHNKTQMEKETVKLKHFSKVLALLREKYGVSTKTCAELIIHEIMPDGSVAVRMEHEEGYPVKLRGKNAVVETAQEVANSVECINPYWASFLTDWEDEEELIKEIEASLTPKVPVRLPKKNRKILVKEN